MNNKFSARDKHMIAHGRNIEKFNEIIRDKNQMINKLKNEIQEIESLIEWNQKIDKALEEEQ